MNINRETLTKLITEHIPDLVDATAAAAASVATHGRKASVSIVVKIGHDKDDENKLHLEIQRKTKQPKNRNQDLTEWTDEELLASYDINEAEGQQRIEGTE